MSNNSDRDGFAAILIFMIIASFIGICLSDCTGGGY